MKNKFDALQKSKQSGKKFIFIQYGKHVLLCWYVPLLMGIVHSRIIFITHMLITDELYQYFLQIVFTAKKRERTVMLEDNLFKEKEKNAMFTYA